jgi:hypothetical protein
MTHSQPQKQLTILVEGRTDKAVVEHLLSAISQDACGSTTVEVCGGKSGVRDAYQEIDRVHTNLIALVDADEPSVPDAEEWARNFFGTTKSNVFCAVPIIEAWVFADKDLAQKYARRSGYAKSVFGRLVTPESLINIKFLVNQVFDRSIIAADFPFLNEINIGRAVASSTSMFRFLRGVETALGNDWPVAEQHLSDSLNRKVFANLLREIPGKTIGWKTLAGEFTAEELGDLVLKGDEVGLRYVTELLRLSRDILAARAIPEAERDTNA